MSAVKKVRREAVDEALRELEGGGDGGASTVALVNLVRSYIQGLEGRVEALELELVEDDECLRENTLTPAPPHGRERGEEG